MKKGGGLRDRRPFFIRWTDHSALATSIPSAFSPA
jgi:hypothetical protein